MPRGPAVALALLALALPLAAAQPQFWRIEGARDFLEGDTKGLSVDSEGRMRLAPAARLLHDPEAPNVWCLAHDPKGTLYAGTGNDGKVFKVEAGKGSLFFDAAELEVHALAVGPDGRLSVGTAPNGKVYAVEPGGRATTFFDPPDKYIWALLFDKGGNLLVATGSDGKIYRVDPKGKAQIVLTSPDTHILSLATDDRGNVYAGSSPSGIIYRLDAALKVFVVHDSAYREVKALDIGTDGSLYAAVVDGKPKDETTRPSAPNPPVVPQGPTAEVTVTESFTVLPPAAGPPAIPPRGPEGPAPGTAKGAVLRILPSGEVDTLWSSPDETPHSLLRSGHAGLVGPGNKGKLYPARDNPTWTLPIARPTATVP